MNDDITKEIDAIKIIITTLSALDETTRTNVMEYVAKKIKFRLSSQAVEVVSPPRNDSVYEPGNIAQSKPNVDQAKPLHLKEFSAKKSPKSANEMAAVVAYYLSNYLPEGEKKSSITIQDIEIYFKIGGFKLPKEPRYTLKNAKSVGLFDLMKDGSYKLSTIGYNLVEHTLPR